MIFKIITRSILRMSIQKTILLRMIMMSLLNFVSGIS